MFQNIVRSTLLQLHLPVCLLFYNLDFLMLVNVLPYYYDIFMDLALRVIYYSSCWGIKNEATV